MTVDPNATETTWIQALDLEPFVSYNSGDWTAPFEVITRLLVDFLTGNEPVFQAAHQKLVHVFDFLSYPEIPLPGGVAAGTLLKIDGPHRIFFSALTGVLKDLWAGDDDRGFEALQRLQLFSGIVGEVEQLAFEIDPGFGAQAAAVRELGDCRRAPRQLIIAPTFRCQMDCAYCFVRQEGRLKTADMDWASFLRVLDWGVANGVCTVSFTGGEPTLHPDFPAFLEELARRKLPYYFNTNNLFDEKVLHGLDPQWTKNIGVHFATDKPLSAKQQDRFDKNLTALARKKIPLIARLNFFEGGTNQIESALENIRRYPFYAVNIAPAFPDLGSKNVHVSLERIEGIFEEYLALVEKISQGGYEVQTAKPIPVCMIPQKTKGTAQGAMFLPTCNQHNNGFVHNLVVDPDGAVRACMVLFDKGPRIWEFTDWDQLSDYFAKNVFDLLLQPVFARCRECFLYKTRRCQGACLAYKIAE